MVNSGPDRTGVHVDGNSPEDIAWGVREILYDDERAKRWGKAARKHVLEYFTWEKAAKETLNIYQDLVQSYGRGGTTWAKAMMPPNGTWQGGCSSLKIKNLICSTESRLKNLKELKDYLVAFTGKEALWVASWLEYLGDKELAVGIRKKPGDFKSIILRRYNELKQYAHPSK